MRMRNGDVLCPGFFMHECGMGVMGVLLDIVIGASSCMPLSAQQCIYKRACAYIGAFWTCSRCHNRDAHIACLASCANATPVEVC